MNENLIIIKLRDFVDTSFPHGNDTGRKTMSKIQTHLDEHSDKKIIGVSLEGIDATDSSFPRESIIALAIYHRKEKGFYLENLVKKDLQDNWDLPAERKNQPLVMWNGDKFKILGPQPSVANMEIIKVAYKNNNVTATYIAEALNISIPNASTKLKKIFNDGLLLRSEDVASSGGREFIYHAIKP